MSGVWWAVAGSRGHASVVSASGLASRLAALGGCSDSHRRCVDRSRGCDIRGDWTESGSHWAVGLALPVGDFSLSVNQRVRVRPLHLTPNDEVRDHLAHDRGGRLPRGPHDHRCSRPTHGHDRNHDVAACGDVQLVARRLSRDHFQNTAYARHGVQATLIPRTPHPAPKKEPTRGGVCHGWFRVRHCRSQSGLLAPPTHLSSKTSWSFLQISNAPMQITITTPARAISRSCRQDRAVRRVSHHRAAIAQTSRPISHFLFRDLTLSRSPVNRQVVDVQSACANRSEHAESIPVRGRFARPPRKNRTNLQTKVP